MYYFVITSCMYKIMMIVYSNVASYSSLLHIILFTHALIFEVLISDKLNRNIQLGRCFIVGFVAGKVKLLYLGSWFVEQGTWISLIKVIVEIQQHPRKRERERQIDPGSRQDYRIVALEVTNITSSGKLKIFR